MNPWQRTAMLALIGCGALVAACDDEGPKSPPAPMTMTMTGGAPAAAGTGGAAGTGSMGGAAGSAPTFTLIEWVDGLVGNHTNATSPPDTVEDKNISGTEDPAAFDHLLK